MTDNFLTREQIDDIVDHMTTPDLFAAMPEGKVDENGQPFKLRGADMAGKVFDIAAERMGHGSGALFRVRIQDATYLAGLLGEVFQSESPKGKSSKDRPASSGTGK